MTLEYPHLIGGPVEEHGDVPCGVEGDRAAIVVQVDHADLGVVAVDPAQVLQSNTMLLNWKKICLNLGISKLKKLICTAL